MTAKLTLNLIPSIRDSIFSVNELLPKDVKFTHAESKNTSVCLYYQNTSNSDKEKFEFISVPIVYKHMNIPSGYNCIARYYYNNNAYALCCKCS